MTASLHQKIKHFEQEYAELASKDISMAKQYFRENFLVKCFSCGKMVKPTKKMCCPECGAYLD
jgi:uncharacterized OB-fold protein